MTPRQLKSFYGSAGKVAQEFEGFITRQGVYKWFKAGRIPRPWQAWIQQRTGGRLKARNGARKKA